jgi:hypothetical protein
MDSSTLITIAGSVGGTLVAGVTAIWKWIARQLEECKSEHKESRARIEELHNEIKVVSSAVGELKGQLSVYQSLQKDVDT